MTNNTSHPNEPIIMSPGNSRSMKGLIFAAGGALNGRVALASGTFERQNDAKKAQFKKEAGDAKDIIKKKRRQLKRGGWTQEERDTLMRSIKDAERDFERRHSSFEAWLQTRKQDKRGKTPEYSLRQEVIDAVGDPPMSEGAVGHSSFVGSQVARGATYNYYGQETVPEAC